MAGNTSSGGFNFLIVRDECGIFDLLKFLVLNDEESGSKFLESFNGGGLLQDGDGDGYGGEVTADHRWVIVVSIIARKIIKVFGKPMEWTGYLLEFILNLLSLNGNFLGLLNNILKGIIYHSQL